MANVVRLGVVGAGAIAQRGILPHVSQPDVQDRVMLQAVCDPVAGRAEAAAAKFKIRHAFTSYEELLAHGDVDAVTSASPIGLHYQQGKQALVAGKHIHFNKTMTTTTAEPTELIELAEAKGLKIVASPGEILRPQIQHVRKLISEGAIGTLCWAVCNSSFGRYHEEENEFRSGNDVLSGIMSNSIGGHRRVASHQSRRIVDSPIANSSLQIAFGVRFNLCAQCHDGDTP